MSLALPATAPSANVRGITAMMGSMAVFVINDTLMKIAAAGLPTGEAIFVRGVFLTILCAILIVHSRVLWALPHALSPRVVLRAVADVGSTVFFIVALVHMPIGDVFGILQFTPLAITAAAALFLGAKVGWRRWTATAVGLVGVLLIVRPGGSAFTPFALLVFVSMLFSVTRDLLSRSVDINVPGLVIVGASAAIVTISSLAFNAFETWVWPSPTSGVLLLLASVALLAGQHWLLAAMRTGEIAVVAPFRYSIILWAILSGYFVWGALPDLASWAGIVIVAGAGIYTFLREQHLARISKA